MAASDKPDLTPDEGAPAPGDEPPGSVPIYGILGKSPVASSARLFLDVGLTTYYDIPIEGIVKREKVPAGESPLGVDSSLLFVLKDIKLVVHHVDTRTVEEEFVSGDFTAPGSFTPAASVGPAVGGVPGLPQTAGFTCTYVACRPTLENVCSAVDACPSRMCPTLGCGNTAATVCTQIGCAPPQSLDICVTLWTQLGCATVDGCS
jgi:hypothetical protein